MTDAEINDRIAAIYVELAERDEEHLWRELRDLGAQLFERSVFYQNC